MECAVIIVSHQDPREGRVANKLSGDCKWPLNSLLCADVPLRNCSLTQTGLSTHCTQSAHWTHERCFRTSVDCSTTTAYDQWTEIGTHSHLYGRSSSWKPALSVGQNLLQRHCSFRVSVHALDRRRTANSITDHLALWRPSTCSGNGNTDILVTCTYSTEWNCRVYKNFAILQFLATWMYNTSDYVCSMQQESTAAVTVSWLSAMSVISSSRLLCSMLEPSTAEQNWLTPWGMSWWAGSQD